MVTLNRNEQALLPALAQLDELAQASQVLLDKSGVGVVEVLPLHVELDPAQPFLRFPGRETDQVYVARELHWYLSQDLHITGWVDDVKIWNRVAGRSRQVNSNYGNLVFSPDNGEQFRHAVETLKDHKDSRQAILIYQRPGMHEDWKADGKADFVCTNFQHLFIRDEQLHCVTNMRSQDAWFGLFNDVPWFHHVITMALAQLQHYYPGLTYGRHVYTVNSFHLYERHFTKLHELVEACRA